MRIVARAASAFIILAAGHVAPVDAGNPFVGKDLYVKHCANCHGERGESKLIGVPNFSHGEVIISSTDPMLLDSIKRGKGTMPAFRGMLKDAELLDVIAYLRTLF